MCFGIPVFGTAAHSWVMSFPHELQAFHAFRKLLGESTVYLIDSYDTIEGPGARHPWDVRCGVAPR